MPRGGTSNGALPVEPDLARGVGPLAGVLTGLTAAPGRPGLFLAVDLPHVPVGLLRRLVERAEDGDAVVPVSPRGPEPLCAVYGPGCLEPIRRRIAAGDFKMTAFWPDVRVLELRGGGARRLRGSRGPLPQPEHAGRSLNGQGRLPARSEEGEARGQRTVTGTRTSTVPRRHQASRVEQ